MRLRSQSLHERCMAHPALIPAVAFAIGIAIARYMPMPIWGIIIPAVATVVFAALGRTLPSLAIGLAMTGYICGDSALPDPLPPSLDGTKVNIIGEVLKAEPGTDRTRYVIEVSQCTEAKDMKTKNNAKTKAKAKAKAKAKTGAENIETSMPSKASADRKSDTKGKIYAEKFRTVLYDNGIYTYRPGDIVSATGILRDARAKDIVPDAADYNRYLYLQGVNSVLWLTKEEMYPISKASDNTLSNILDKARAATTNAIIDSGAGSDASAFLTAVIVGDDSYLQPDTDEAFRTSGLAHLLALSGLHVGIIIMFITVCLSWMRPSRYGYRIFYILIIAASFAYAAFAGMTPSVVRAACMVAVLCVSAIFQRRANVYNSLCVAIFLWLVINPLWLFAPGFQMSVCAVLGITIALRAVNAYRIRRTWVKKALRIFIVPMAAMAATAIPAMAYFHTFPLYFLPANILASIAIVPMMFCGVLLAIATMTGIGHGALAYACDRLYAFIEFSAKTFGGDSGVVHTYPSMLTIFCCLAAVAAFFFFLYRPRSIMRISMLCCACIFIALSSSFDRSRVSIDAYILSGGTSTDMLLADADSVYLITDATGINAANIRTLRQQRYRDMLLRRTTNAELVLLSGNFTRHEFKRSGDILTCGKHRFLLVNSDSLASPSERCEYALVCRGFKGDIKKVALHADTIVIGTSVHYTRRRRFVAFMDSAGIPYRDIRSDGGLALHIASY